MAKQNEIKVGDWVVTNSSFSCSSRRCRVGEIFVSHHGHTLYRLIDGGVFSRNEIEKDR